MRRLALCALLFVAACGSSATFTKTADFPHDPKPVSPPSVQFYSTDRPFRDFVEVGEIKASSALGDTPAMNALREEAAQHGCDGVILKKREDGVGVAGTCIMYK